jgi:hypothetical protein
MRTDWENGTILLSPKNYNKYKLEFLEIYNYQLTEEMHNANNLVKRVRKDWDYVINPPKAKGKPPEVPEVNYYEYSLPLRQFYSIDPSTFEKLWKKDDHMSPPQYLNERNIGYARPNQRKFDVDGYEATIEFNTAKKTITWNVSQNVDAVKTARQSFVGREFFRTMDELEWTGKYGGDIIGNDSDNMANRGENYITYSF